MIWIFVSPNKIHMLKPNLQGQSICRWGLWEVCKAWEWSPWEWDLCGYTRKPLSLNAARSLILSSMCRHSKMMSMYGPGSKQELTRPWVCQCLILEFLASRSVRNQRSPLKSPSLGWLRYSSPDGLSSSSMLKATQMTLIFVVRRWETQDEK